MVDEIVTDCQWILTHLFTQSLDIDKEADNSLTDPFSANLHLYDPATRQCKVDIP